MIVLTQSLPHGVDACGCPSASPTARLISRSKCGHRTAATPRQLPPHSANGPDAAGGRTRNSSATSDFQIVCARQVASTSPLTTRTSVLGYTDHQGVDPDLHSYALADCCSSEVDRGFWHRAVLAERGRRAHHVLCASDQLLHVCVHGQRSSLIPSAHWMADAITILRRAGDSMAWDTLLAEARERRLTYQLRRALSALEEEHAIASRRTGGIRDAATILPASVGQAAASVEDPQFVKPAGDPHHAKWRPPASLLPRLRRSRNRRPRARREQTRAEGSPRARRTRGSPPRFECVTGQRSATNWSIPGSARAANG